MQQQLSEHFSCSIVLGQSKSDGPLNLETGAYDGSQAEQNVAGSGLLVGILEFDRRETSREDLNPGTTCVCRDARCLTFSTLWRLKSVCAPSAFHVPLHSFSSSFPLFELFASRASHDTNFSRASLAPSPFIESITALMDRPGSHIPRHNVILLKGTIQLRAQILPRSFFVIAVAL